MTLGFHYAFLLFYSYLSLNTALLTLFLNQTYSRLHFGGLIKEFYWSPLNQ